MNKYPHVFQPIKVRGLTIKNRIQFTPMVCCLSNAEGEVTNEIVQFLSSQAATGVGYVTIGDTQVDHERAMCFYGELNVLHDKYITGLSLLAEEVHRYGAKLSIELAHAGRGGVPSMNVKPGFAPSNVPIPGCMQDLKVMDRDDMDWVVKRFFECTTRVRKADFDMIMVHSGHNNLLGQFLSPESNFRTDEYGGSLENRMRFPLEILKAIRQAAGDKMVLEMRVSGDEMTRNGLRFEECIEYVKRAQEYIDIAHFSCGNVFMAESVKYTAPLYLQEHMQNVRFAAAAKKVLHIPVSVVGNIFSMADAEEIIASGKADIVGMCRSLMADPELLHKSQKGEEADIRPCLRCMDGCGRIFHGYPVRCAVNPVNGREYRYRNIQKSEKPKKIVIIGGGPAGMQAAQTLIKRGHEVILYEQEGQLGGLLHDGGAVTFKKLMRDYAQWDIHTTMKCGATVKLNTKVTPELIIAEKADAVIFATGSTFIKPNIPGIDDKNVKMLRNVEREKETVGQKIVVCGGGLSGVECAVNLAKQGKDVSVVDMIPESDFCKDMFYITRIALFDEVKKYGVSFFGDYKIIRFTSEGVVTAAENGEERVFEADTCIIAMGLKSENSLAKELQTKLSIPTYIVGDCNTIGTVRSANFDAFNIAVEL
ncbi:2,4-dienoyl-CoA reductase [Propionispira arboris]|uniref:2,4-dienoyl-CoA reductase n=1 Tax=Propionispira arboris TaxID=84035 RepID=A0A1H6XPH1_9FIRM|nr:FAD-dependent oxidoreductase [Propionispira arboris]SEJ29484.1 2,4-dienoyl-CoA reductase [Propionispira arboris]